MPEVYYHGEKKNHGNNVSVTMGWHIGACIKMNIQLYDIIVYNKSTWTQNQIFRFKKILITTIIIQVVKQKATWQHGNIIILFFTLNYVIS